MAVDATKPHFLGGEGAREGHQGPECDARTHDKLPVVPVTQVSEDGSQEHVATDKDWKQSSNITRGRVLQT